MNYLSHFHLNRQVGESAAPSGWFAAGVMVPDLWSAYARRGGQRRPPLDWARIRAADQRQPLDPAAVSLRRGLLNHARADADFHGSQAFRHWCRRLRTAAARYFERPSLAGFLAHVGVELTLDRLLLRAHSDLAERFYAELDSVDPAALAQGLTRLSGQDDLETFGEWFAEFGQRRHLTGYVQRRAVAHSLERVLALVVPTPPAAAELERFVEATEAVLESGPCSALEPAEWLGWHGPSEPEQQE